MAAPAPIQNQYYPFNIYDLATYNDPLVTNAAEWCNLKDSKPIKLCCKNKRKSAGKHPVTNEKLIWKYI
jgi:hypothetical protein